MPSKSSYIKMLSLSLFIGVWAFSLSGQTNTWQPAMAGILEFTNVIGRPPRLYKDGPNGRPWVVGSFLDEDSVYRIAAYWEGQIWKPLPIKFSYGSTALSMVKYGDTTYIGGSFTVIGFDSVPQPSFIPSGLIKIHADSFWIEDPWRFYFPEYWTVQNDTLLVLNAGYYGPRDTVEYVVLTDNGGASWRYPFNPKHPTSPSEDPSRFGILMQARIHNGDIYITNNADSLGSPYRGVARWDGQQWHSLGKGTPGFNSGVWTLEFFQGDLYIGGTFNQRYFPDDPGVHFARWDGNQWHASGNPVNKVLTNLVKDDTVLYAISRGDTFGDVRLPGIAAWDGHKWCGTPTDFVRSPVSVAPLEDTLIALFYENAIINGVQMPNLVYFDGDYLNNPNTICSSADIGIQEPKLAEELFSVYPNPTQGDFTLVSDEMKGAKQVELFSVQGSLIQSWTWPKEELKFEICTKGHAPGVYIIKVNGSYAQQIIIH